MTRMAAPDFEIVPIQINYFSDYWGPFTFTLPIESAAGANDGMIPFGDSVASVNVRSFLGKLSIDDDLSEATEVTDLVDPTFTPTVTSDTVTVRLQCPASSALAGKKLTLVFEITTTSGAKNAFFFHYVKVK